jgi:hypothetical protein
LSSAKNKFQFYFNYGNVVSLSLQQKTLTLREVKKTRWITP